jgi:DNA-binding MarR family transcriptional regulator
LVENLGPASSRYSWQTVAESDPERAIYRLFRLVQQRNRYVQKEPTTNLSLLEAHILTEIDAKPGVKQKELLEMFHVSQASLSLAGSELEKRGLLLRVASEDDKREINYRLTVPGKRVVKESDLVTDRTFTALSKELSQDERKELVNLLRSVADGLGEIKQDQRRNEDSFRLHQRRVTRALGLLKSKVYGSQYSPLEWQVLSEVALHSGSVIAKDLGERLGVKRSTLTIVIARLRKAKLIAYKRLALDNRSKVLHVTQDGEKAIDGIEKFATQKLKLALKTFSLQQKRRWIKVLSVYALGELAESKSQSDEVTFHVALTEEQKSAARSFIVKQAVSENFTQHLPCRIASPEQLTVYGKTQKQELCVALNIDLKDGNSISSGAALNIAYYHDLRKWLSESLHGPRLKKIKTSRFAPLSG